MPEILGRRLALLGFVLLCSIGSLSAGWQMRHWGDALSRVDPFSEANAIREVYNFLDTGITANDGLGNVLRPGVYPHQGFEAGSIKFAQSVTPSGVYTHYPPGSEYILYAAMRLLGTRPIARLRIVPLILTWAAAVFFGLSLRRRFGTPVATMVMLACAMLPAFSDADTFLYYDGYAFALLLVEIGVALGTNVLVLPFLLLGFLQGWLSFDYCFLVTLVPGALELALPRLGINHTARLRLAFWRCFAAGAGFTPAHLLHFAEVCAYYGSVHAAIRDLSGAARFRDGADAGGMLVRLFMIFVDLGHYFVDRYPISVFFWHPDAGQRGNWQVFRFAGLTLGVWWLLLTHVFLIARWTRRGRTVRPIDNDWLMVTLYGVVPSALWFIVMPAHGLVHVRFLYRHLFFCFFLGLLFCATALAGAAQSIRERLQDAFPGPTARHDPRYSHALSDSD